jgi:hypothetical protein
MSWIGPAAKRALKYGPYVQQAWKHAGKPAQEAARRSLSTYAAQRTALQHADTVVDGSVLPVMQHGSKVFVVFSADEPVAAYPSVTTPFSELVGHADLGKRVTPAQVRERQRLGELRRRATGRVRRMRGRGQAREIPPEPGDQQR